MDRAARAARARGGLAIGGLALVVIVVILPNTLPVLPIASLHKVRRARASTTVSAGRS